MNTLFEKIFKSRSEIMAKHWLLDLGQNILMVLEEAVLSCTFVTWIQSVPYIGLSIGHPIIFRAQVTLCH